MGCNSFNLILTIYSHCFLWKENLNLKMVKPSPIDVSMDKYFSYLLDTILFSVTKITNLISFIEHVMGSSDNFTDLKFRIYKFFKKYQLIFFAFFFNCSNWKRVMEEILETNWWKYLMDGIQKVGKVMGCLVSFSKQWYLLVLRCILGLWLSSYWKMFDSNKNIKKNFIKSTFYFYLN